jgi:acetyltransferase-like isoleucine patch superfamily enzyme
MTLIVIINYVYIYTNNHQYAYEINNIFYLLICLFFVLSKNICILVVSISGAK